MEVDANLGDEYEIWERMQYFRKVKCRPGFSKIGVYNFISLWFLVELRAPN